MLKWDKFVGPICFSLCETSRRNVDLNTKLFVPQSKEFSCFFRRLKVITSRSVQLLAVPKIWLRMFLLTNLSCTCCWISHGYFLLSFQFTLLAIYCILILENIWHSNWYINEREISIQIDKILIISQNLADIPASNQIVHIWMYEILFPRFVE